MSERLQLPLKPKKRRLHFALFSPFVSIYWVNKGKFNFQDVTDEAKVNFPGRWNSGVTVVDINNDGWQDLYISCTMNADSMRRANMLLLNKGVNEKEIPVFEEVAEQYGIADKGYSIMSAFFDYDKDGDLDLYVLTNKHSKEVASNYRIKINDGSSPSTALSQQWQRILY